MKMKDIEDQITVVEERIEISKEKLIDKRRVEFLSRMFF